MQSAISAYSPIATTVSGNPKFSVQVRLLLARSLVCSRLFQRTQVWSAVSLWSLRKLNTVYMRVLRRIAARLRFDSSCGITDRHVRVLLNMPAIELFIAQLRLGHLRQVLTSPVPQLRALLAVKDKEGQPFPWVQLVHSNLRTHLITSFLVQWKQLIRCLDSPVSVLDKPDPREQSSTPVPQFACQECLHIGSQRSFFSQRALDMHLVRVHRSSIRQYIGPDNRRPVCHKTFALRRNAIARASRIKPCSGEIHSCCQVILSGSVEKVPDDTLRPLVDDARWLRTVARRMGRSHFPAPWGHQRTRKASPYDGDCHPKPAKRRRWAPLLCP